MQADIKYQHDQTSPFYGLLSFDKAILNHVRECRQSVLKVRFYAWKSRKKDHLYRWSIDTMLLTLLLACMLFYAAESAAL